MKRQGIGNEPVNRQWRWHEKQDANGSMGILIPTSGIFMDNSDFDTLTQGWKRKPPISESSILRCTMRFYLSSFRLGDETDRLLEMVGDSRRIAFIPNALFVSGGNVFVLR